MARSAEEKAQETPDAPIVAAMTRSRNRAVEFQKLGIRPIIGDVTSVDRISPEDQQTLAESLADGQLLYAVGYDRSSPASLTEVYTAGLRNVLDWISTMVPPCPVKRMIYLSSTGVYGDFHGSWVDEESPCEPQREGGRACLEAESILRSHPVSASTHLILRLAGIYGPNRVPRVKEMTSGKAMPQPPNTWLNLIHVDDIVALLHRLFDASDDELPALPSTLCVSDGAPVRRLEYYETMAQLAGAPAPAWEPASSDAAASSEAKSPPSRAAADKRISNARLQQWMSQLKLSLKHPDFRSGLRSILTA